MSEYTEGTINLFHDTEVFVRLDDVVLDKSCHLVNMHGPIGFKLNVGPM